MNSKYTILKTIMKKIHSMQTVPTNWIYLLVLTCITTACSQELEETSSLKPHTDHEHHTHHEHHRHIIQLPENSGVELEFLSSGKRNQIEIHVINAKTHKPYSIDSEKIQATFHTGDQDIPVIFVASPLEEDPDSQSSRFVLPFEELPQQLKLLNDFQVTLTLELDGKSVTGTLDHKNDHQHHHE